jgi:hypothetical protein
MYDTALNSSPKGAMHPDLQEAVNLHEAIVA